MAWRFMAVAVALMALGVACSGASESSAKSSAEHDSVESTLPVITFTTAADQTVPLAVEVADDGGEMSCGLMHRTDLPENQGMIFVYRVDSGGGFWMRNTLIPLSIAYVAADGRIVDILDMQPVPGPGFTPFELPNGEVVAVPDGQAAPPGAVWKTYTPRALYRFAIEVNWGWFARHGIAIGHRVDLAAAVASADAAAPPPLCEQRGT